MSCEVMLSTKTECGYLNGWIKNKTKQNKQTTPPPPQKKTNKPQTKTKQNKQKQTNKQKKKPGHIRKNLTKNGKP